MLAAFFWQEKRVPEAESAFKTLATIGETDPQHRAALANFYVSTKRFDLAEKEYSEILAKHKDDLFNRMRFTLLFT